MRTKLSYIDDTPQNQTGWHQKASNFPYSVAEANDIADNNNVFSQKALAAIPSPLARIHIFETAFEFVTKQMSFLQDSVFHRMVSNVLDVWELMFNLQIHKEAGLDISIKTWDGISQLNSLIASNESNHSHVGKVLKQYIEQSTFSSMNSRFDLIFIDRHLIASTSPLTGFFTAIDCHQVINLPLPNSPVNRRYFNDRAVSILDRDPEFIQYLYTVFFNNRYMNRFPALFSYLNAVYQNRSLWGNISKVWVEVDKLNTANPKIDPESLYNRIKSDMQTDLTSAGLNIYSRPSTGGTVLNSPLLLDIISSKLPKYISNIPLIFKDSHNWMEVYDSTIHVASDQMELDINDRLLPGTSRKYPFLYIDDFFEKTILRVPYQADSSKFYVLLNDEQERKSYLLPLKPLVFELFRDEPIDRMLTAEKTHDGIAVTIKIKIQNGRYVEYRKPYCTNPQLDNYGKIEEVTFDIGFFPFYRIQNTTTEIEYLNKDSRVHISYNNFNSESSDVALNFYKKDFSDIAITPDVYDLSRPAAMLNRVDDQQGLKSDVYSVREDFRIVRIRVGRNSNFIIPKFKEFRIGNIPYNVSVDFGTTNTHVAIAPNRDDAKKFTIGVEDIQTVTYSAHPDAGGLTLSEIYAKESIITLGSMQSIVHQFVPPIIGEGYNPYYDFPTRTVVSTAKNRDIYPLFTSNVAFFHSKDRVRGDETIESELKWELSGSVQKQSLTQAYLEQLLMMIKHKIVMNSGNPANMRLVWFLPLSLDQPSVQFFKKNWVDLLSRVFPGVQIPDKQITESEAPFYYFQSIGRVYGEENTLCIDIGGGSTDVSFFEKGNPIFFTSFNFAGNTLWNNGYHGKHGVNNILNYYSNIGVQGLMLPIQNNPNLKIMFESARSQITGSTLDLMNFYFAWDQFINFSDQFKVDGNIKFLFLFHYSAILFHIYKLCEAKNKKIPRYFCHSGKGSKMLHALDSSNNKESLKKYVSEFLKVVDGGKSQSSIFDEISINLVGNEKEITCNGGIEFLKTIPTSGVPISGTSLFLVTSGELKTLDKAFKITELDESTKEKIANDILEFLEAFAKTTKSFNLEHFFKINVDSIHLNQLNGTKVDIYDINTSVIQNVRDALERGITYKKSKSGVNQQINESPFFFPLVQLIHEMGNELYK